MEFFNLPFEQASPPFDEDSISYLGEPIDYVKELSKGKACSLCEKYPSRGILTADTIVFKDGKIYGKPKSANEAFFYLMNLQGQWHSVFSGVCLYYQDKYYQAVDETRVLFNNLTEEQIRLYHSKMEWRDKAGGYAIQMAGGLIVRKIDGCYYNVMGLPINSVRELLQHMDIDLWNCFK